MPQIEVDFDTWKALTTRRRSEAHTYNDVIREALDIDKGKTVHALPPLLEAVAGITQFNLNGPAKGMSFRGLFLPNGTLLRASYKGSHYVAKIDDGKWINEDGQEYGSPSAAATAITNTNANGWRFWQAKRPSDGEWRSLDAIPKD
jgi:hypothetical protein